MKVLSVCTDPSPLLDNWKNSLELQKYEYEVLGLGEKWGGWTWRTRQYIKKLANEPEEKLFVLTDATDLFFIAPPNELVFNFKTYRSDVVVGAEHSPMTGPLRSDFKMKEMIIDFVKTRNPWTRYIVPNGGFIMGFRTPLLNILCANLNQEDDQHGYLLNWLGHPNDIKLDIYARLVANIVYDIPFFLEDDERVEMDYFQLYKGTNGVRVKSIETDGTPCAMHFPGGNSEAYNYFVKAIYKNKLSQWVKKKMLLTDTMKKSWAQTLKANLIPKFLSSTYVPKEKLLSYDRQNKLHQKRNEFSRMSIEHASCDAHFKDCNGICGGPSILNCNDSCYDPTKESPNVILDCLGICGGNATLDCKEICGGTHELDCDKNCYDPKTEDPVVIIDCKGVCGGCAVINYYGECCDLESEDSYSDSCSSDYSSYSDYSESCSEEYD